MPGHHRVDAVDRSILRLLQADARRSNADISRALGLAPSTVLERIRRLEAQGVIQGYEAHIDPRALGLFVTAFVFVAATELGKEDALEQALLGMPEVVEVHKIAGEDAFLAKIRGRDNASLGARLRESIESVGVRSIRTTIVLGTSRERLGPDLGGLPEGPDEGSQE